MNNNVYNTSFFQVSLFVDNEQLLRVKDQFNRAMYLNSRLSASTVIPLDRNVPRYLDLHEVIIIGNNGDQVSDWVITFVVIVKGSKVWRSRRLLGVNGTDFSRLLVPSYFSCLKLSVTTFVRSYGYVKLGLSGF